MSHDLHLEFVLPASPERVMELLTDVQLIEEWSGSDAIFENVVGGRCEMFDGWVTGKVLVTEPYELGYTWFTTDWPEGTTPSEVHYKLESEGDGTKVILDHTGLPNHEEVTNHTDGWSEHFFGPMEEYILGEDIN